MFDDDDAFVIRASFRTSWASSSSSLMMMMMMMMMMFEEPCRSMGKDSSQYGRAVPQWPRVCHMLMMTTMVLLTNDSCHAFIGDNRIGW